MIFYNYYLHYWIALQGNEVKIEELNDPFNVKAPQRNLYAF